MPHTANNVSKTYPQMRYAMLPTSAAVTVPVGGRPLYLVKPNDMGMAQDFHDLHLPHDLLQVIRVQLRLVNDLDGHLWSHTHLTAEKLRQKHTACERPDSESTGGRHARTHTHRCVYKSDYFLFKYL